MSRRRELLALLFGDFIALNAAWFGYYWIRMHSGWFSTEGHYFSHSYLAWTSLFLYGMWLVAFTFFGLYRSWYVRPIFDEVVTVLKTIAFGTFIFALIFFWE